MHRLVWASHWHSTVALYQNFYWKTVLLIYNSLNIKDSNVIFLKLKLLHSLRGVNGGQGTETGWLDFNGSHRIGKQKWTVAVRKPVKVTCAEIWNQTVNSFQSSGPCRQLPKCMWRLVHEPKDVAFWFSCLIFFFFWPFGEWDPYYSLSHVH